MKPDPTAQKFQDIMDQAGLIPQGFVGGDPLTGNHVMAAVIDHVIEEHDIPMDTMRLLSFTLGITDGSRK